MKKNMYPYVKRKKSSRPSTVSKRISSLQAGSKRKGTSTPQTLLALPQKNGRPRGPAFVSYEKRRWKLHSAFFLCVLGVVILLLPSAIVLPFSQQNDDGTVAERNSFEDEPQNNVDDSSLTVPVMRTQSEKLEHVPLETYVARVIASEMPAEFEIEALKAQGVAARTYIVDLLLHHGDATDAFISDQTDDQVYTNDEELREIWGSDYNWKMDKLLEAVAATEGEVITYNEMTITPAYFSTSNGYTENSEDYWENEIPYLRSVESKWDEESPSFLDQRTFTKNEIEEALAITLSDDDLAHIEMTHTDSQRVEQIKIGDHEFSGRDIREKLDLKSSDFTIEQKNNHFVFNTKGFGHGIGMSQYGANGMAKEGKTYKEILAYYYNGIDVQMVDEIAPMLVQK